MTVFEYAGRVLIVDCGVLFPEENHPGVDLILPDWSSISDRLDDGERLAGRGAQACALARLQPMQRALQPLSRRKRYLRAATSQKGCTTPLTSMARDTEPAEPGSWISTLNVPAPARPRVASSRYFQWKNMMRASVPG